MLDLTGQTILAPLTKGGNLPFRRLCVELGARTTMSEMAYARNVLRRRPSEMALLRRHETEPCFGVQLAVGRPHDGVEAGRLAAERGAAFVDINAGCPIHDVIRRGMGATLMRRPDALVRIVEAMVAELPVPVTVKLRSGWNENEIIAVELARLVEDAGASAITLHARTRDQRYTKAADWALVGEVAHACRVPVIGNGDILTWHEAERRREESGCTAVMVGRGALIKPWLFREIAERRTWLPAAEERVAVYARFVELLKEHFRDDEKGRARAMRFLPWHVQHFARYRPIPDEVGVEQARTHPLLQTRWAGPPASDPLEALLRDSRGEVHERIAEALWAATSAEDTVARLRELAAAAEPVEAEPAEVAVAQG